jgi:hypothetical protein
MPWRRSKPATKPGKRATTTDPSGKPAHRR